MFGFCIVTADYHQSLEHIEKPISIIAVMLDWNSSSRRLLMSLCRIWVLLFLLPAWRKAKFYYKECEAGYRDFAFVQMMISRKHLRKDLFKTEAGAAARHIKVDSYRYIQDYNWSNFKPKAEDIGKRAYGLQKYSMHQLSRGLEIIWLWTASLSWEWLDRKLNRTLCGRVPWGMEGIKRAKFYNDTFSMEDKKRSTISRQWAEEQCGSAWSLFSCTVR